MEKFFRSVAMIRRYEKEMARWMVVWDSENNWWDFVIGRRLENESFRETAIREVAWQLGIQRSDFLVSNMSQLNMEYLGQLPGELTEKHIAVAFYAVDLYKSSIFARLQRTDFRWTWLTSNEVCAGQQNDHGPLLNPLICHWINKWQIVLPWQ